MPRDNDDDNARPRGRPDRPSGDKGKPRGRSGAPRGPEKKLARRGLAGKSDTRKSDRSDGDKRPYAGKSDGAKASGKKPYARPYAGAGKPYAGKRDGATARPRFNRDDGGEKRPYTPRGESFRKDGDRPQRARPQGDRPYGARPPREGGGEKRPYTPRGDRPFGDKKAFSRGGPDRGPRGPRKEFGDREGRDRSGDKPWQKRDAGPRDDRGGSRPSRDGAGRPRFSKPREDRVERAAGADRGPRKFDRPQGDRPRYDRRSDDRPRFDRPRQDRPDGDRPRGASNAWQERPRRDARDDRPRRNDRDDRPRRDNEDDSQVFAKRPAFGGRGAYRERAPETERRGARAEPKPKKAGERVAKVISRAGLASRRDAEEMVTQGRVAVNGRIINSPALDVIARDVVTVDGEPLPERERTRLFLYHKPRGLMTTHADPEGRPTVFDHLPEGLPRLISVGRLDFNTEGLLLLTNDGGLARALELPDTGWLRRYRVRAHGEVTQAQLDALKNGVEVDGVKYGSIDATLERDQGANVWLTFAIREGKNREVRNVMAHLGLEVNRLIRISYGPFQLAEIAEGEVEEVKTRVLREQLGDRIAALANMDLASAAAEAGAVKLGRDGTPLRSKKDNKARAKRSLIEDRQGRSVVVQRTGSDEARARNEAEANGYGPPRRPKRGYHGKRDLTPKDG
ncbi:pseudouridine synthase [Nitrobacter winogradskyi]|uniref:23S rRNA pseudouridine2605 synthase n=2 Tax=Nitrobacter winogradskyi TaxID=913 RepID=A0ACC6AID2_NITWI|nr:pseudouridine synthase [Nitrobacter winogradskyi]MCP1999278.1 23S rRNA pseudouridine2605 synthase [Nitrobacter winogradskyi]